MNFKFFYNTDANTLESINNNGIVLVQGQADSVEFYFYFKSYDTNESFSIQDMFQRTCLVNIERPDGVATNNVLTTPVIDDGDFYYKLIINDFVTSVNGILTITPKLFDNASEITTTFGVATLNILESASVSQSTIEDFQYEAILNFLSNLPITKYECIAFFPIEKGNLVMITGTENGKLRVSPAGILENEGVLISIHKNPELILGIALSNANSGEELTVFTQGIINGLDTSLYEEGKKLVPHGTINGRLIEIDNINNSNFTPVAPKNRMPIAISIFTHATNGIMFVRPTYFPTMSQVHDVDMTGIEINNVLAWDGQKFVSTYMSGVYYNNDVPSIEDRFVNLTYFDEAEIDHE